MMMLSRFVCLANPKSITIADIAPHATWGENKSVELKGAYPQVNSTPGEWRDGSYGKDYFAGAYRMGYGAGCEYLTPPQSYWCQPLGRVTRTIIAEFWAVFSKDPASRADRSLGTLTMPGSVRAVWYEILTET